MDLVNQIAALATIAMGLFGLFMPERAAAFVGLQPVTNAGRSEFRATYGGLWLPLGAVPLLTGEPIAFAIAGLCWVSIAMGRVISIMIDRVGDAKNWAGVAFEAALGVALLAGAPLGWLLSFLDIV